MSDNPITRAVSPRSRRQQAPAPQPQPKGKVVKQSKTKIEYRPPESELGEEYLGACNHPFTKSQYERLVRSPKMPPSFLSIRASKPKDGKVCLYASKVFSKTAVEGLIGKLKRSCTKAAGKGSKAACNELISDLGSRIKKPHAGKSTQLPDQYDLNSINPLSKKFWVHLGTATIGGAGFAIGMGIVNWIWGKVTGRSIVQRIKDYFKNGNGDGTGKTGDGTTDTPEPPAVDNASKMVAAALGTLAGLMRDIDDVDPIPFPPIVPVIDTIDSNYLIDPNSTAQAAYNGMSLAEWSAANTYSNAAIGEGLKKVVVGIGLAVGAVIATIFGPKIMPKGMLQPSPAGFGGGGLMPGGGRRCSPLVGCTPDVI
jgi:hypothetical protein